MKKDNLVKKGAALFALAVVMAAAAASPAVAATRAGFAPSPGIGIDASWAE